MTKDNTTSKHEIRVTIIDSAILKHIMVKCYLIGMINRCIFDILIITLICFSTLSVAQQKCEVEKVVFNAGEQLSYEVYYHWGLIWANAGMATFSVKKDVFQNKPVLHLTGEGSTHKNYDWFYKVRDKFESWVDTSNLKPLRYVRNSNEGSNHVYNDNYFNFKRKHAICYKIKKKETQKDTIKITDCTFDVMTMIYYARCIDYSEYKPNTKIPIQLYLDGELYDKLYIRYIGKEKIKTAIGEVNCIKFKPLLIPGTIFSGGEEMTVWVSDDKYKVPLLITSPIVVGEVQVKIKETKY